MKKIMLIVLIAAFSIPAMVSCKKGANDPSISLKSRNSRITADWNLIGIEGTWVTVAGGTTVNRIYSYNGTTYTETIGGTSNSGVGSFEMTIDKDGLYNFKESFTPNGGTADVISGDGQWYWEGNDNNKISLRLTDGGNTLFGGGTYLIDRLASKELVLWLNWSFNDNGNTTTVDIKFTFEAQ